MTIEFTQEEANALLTLIDLAVKAGGLNVAQAAAHLAGKIQAAAQPVTEETTDGI